MKKLSCTLIASLVLLANLGRAQSVFFASESGCGIPAVDGYYYSNTISGVISNSSSPAWFLSNTGGIWSLASSSWNSGATTFFSMTTNLYGGWTNNPLTSYHPPFPVFSTNPPPDPTTPIFSTTLTNFWPASGGNVTMTASGITGTNDIMVITANSNVVFTSGTITNLGIIWNLHGTMNYDGSNVFNSAFSIAGIGAPGSSFFTVSNFIGTNVSLTIALDALYDTNLTVQNVQISGQQAVAGTQPVFTWPPQLTFLPFYTPATTNSSTFGYGAGLLTCDTNYLYISIGTNAWRRMSIPLGVW